MRRRDKTYKQASICGSDRLWSKFRALRNKLVGALREAKRVFLQSMSGKIKDTNQFWAAYRSISSTTSRVPSTLTNGVSMASTSFDRATLMNDHFATFFTPPHSASVSVPPVVEGVPSLSTLQCSGADVMSIVGGLRAKIACGPDQITSTVLKKCAPAIAEPLAEVFNTSLATGRLPSEWKESHVVPVFKAGDSTEVNNYRPISLLSLVSKVLERVVHNGLL